MKLFFFLRNIYIYIYIYIYWKTEDVKRFLIFNRKMIKYTFKMETNLLNKIDKIRNLQMKVIVFMNYIIHKYVPIRILNM